MMDEIDLIPIINSIVRWDETQWNLSPGELIAAMLISCFCRRQALYKLEKFYQYQDLELLFGRVKAFIISSYLSTAIFSTFLPTVESIAAR